MRRISVMLFVIASITAAQAAEPSGTASEARALLAKAVTAVQADEANALAQFAKRDGGFTDRDLYVFCAGDNHKISAHPNPTLMGKDTKDVKDANGLAFVDEMIKVAKPDTVSEVNYVFPRLGTTQPVPKTTFTTKVKDQVCGVGYYR